MDAGCQAHTAPALPLATCGRPRVPRALDRQDLFCETVWWQWNELGDVDGDEWRANGCPTSESPGIDDVQVQKQREKATKKRHLRHLGFTQIPAGLLPLPDFL